MENDYCDDRFQENSTSSQSKKEAPIFGLKGKVCLPLKHVNNLPKL